VRPALVVPVVERRTQGVRVEVERRRRPGAPAAVNQASCSSAACSARSATSRSAPGVAHIAARVPAYTRRVSAVSGCRGSPGSGRPPRPESCRPARPGCGERSPPTLSPTVAGSCRSRPHLTGMSSQVAFALTAESQSSASEQSLEPVSRRGRHLAPAVGGRIGSPSWPEVICRP
jgi:hypothetical protein